MYEKKIRIQQENSYKINFPATTTKKTQLHNTKYEHNSKNYFPPESKS